MGDKRISLEKAGPATIVAAMGLATRTRATPWCDPDEPIALEAIQSRSVHPRSALTFAKTLDSGKFGEALNRLVRDDPTLKTHTDEETKETILSGWAELHLEISNREAEGGPGRAAGGTEQITLGKPRVRTAEPGAADRLPVQVQKQTGAAG